MILSYCYSFTSKIEHLHMREYKLQVNSTCTWAVPVHLVRISTKHFLSTKLDFKVCISKDKLHLCSFSFSPGPNFMALLTAKFCAYNHHSPLPMQAPNFCASCVSEECLVMWQMHQVKIPANLWNLLDVKHGIPFFHKHWFFDKQSHDNGPRFDFAIHTLQQRLASNQSYLSFNFAIKNYRTCFGLNCIQ